MVLSLRCFSQMRVVWNSATVDFASPATSTGSAGKDTVIHGERAFEGLYRQLPKSDPTMMPPSGLRRRGAFTRADERHPADGACRLGAGA